MFNAWGFDTIRGQQPDFVLKTEKKLCVSYLRKNYDLNPTKDFVKRYPHRISSIKIDLKGVLLNHLNWYPANFINLISLDLEHVSFDNDSLLVLAPQLENLSLIDMQNGFDVSSVDEESKSFTKLKSLKLINADIFGAKEILVKCCNTLEYLECDTDQNYGFNDIVVEISTLHKLIIYIINDMSARNLISKCSGSLRTLDVMVIDAEFSNNLCSLLVQTMKITTLVIPPTLGTNIEILLSKCPLIQNLSIHYCYYELKEVCLTDLKELKLINCGDDCMTSAVNNIFKSSKASVKILHLEIEEDNKDEIEIECEFTEIPEIDTVWCSWKAMGSEESDRIRNLFPRKSEAIFFFFFCYNILYRERII